MKTKTTTLLVLLVFLMNTGFKEKTEIMIPSENSGVAETDSQFTLVRSDEHISIFSRRIPVNSDRSTRQLKALFLVESPAENVLNVLRDEKSYTNWMKATKTCFRLKTIDTNCWYSYVQFSIPWPLNNQDCILKYNISTNQELATTSVNIISEPDYLGTYKGVERISHMEGEWILTQLDQGKTRVEYFV